jgi:glycine betaine catabolism B
MPEWITVARTEDIPEGEMIGAKVNGFEVLVANLGGQFRAIGSVCTHQGGPLAEGEISDGVVICPWHQGHFDLETGEAVSPPPTEDEPVYEVKVEGDEIKIAKPAT